jgi:hypothetical protein
MRINRAVAALVSLVSTAAVLIAVAPEVAAASWVKTSTTKQSAYSWNSYKVAIAPAGFAIPRGYIKVSATVTVKRGSTTIASNRSAVSVSGGTYAAYSLFKYRAKTPYTAYRTVEVNGIDADSCDVTAVTPSGSTIGYEMTCSGMGYDADYNSLLGTYTTAASQYLYSPSDAPWWTLGETIYQTDPNWYQMDGVTSGTGSQAYTAYRYGAIKAKYVYRTVIVSKVVNTPVMTLTEWRNIWYGNSLARVRKVVGSNGSLYRAYSNGIEYRWKNSSGGYSYILFTNGIGATNYWWM